MQDKHRLLQIFSDTPLVLFLASSGNLCLLASSALFQVTQLKLIRPLDDRLAHLPSLLFSHSDLETISAILIVSQIASLLLCPPMPNILNTVARDDTEVVSMAQLGSCAGGFFSDL